MICHVWLIPMGGLLFSEVEDVDGQAKEVGEGHEEEGGETVVGLQTQNNISNKIK